MARARELVVAFAVTAIASLFCPVSNASAETATPSCVKHQGHARYQGFAWDHIVSIRNECEKAVACTVTTSANPEATNADVPARQEQHVVTFLGSPSRDFTYDLTCRLASD